ncbi:20597_t:CDS:2, partial [Funneliformis geosporum]
SSNYQPNNTFSTTPQRNNLICYLCKQPGHIKRNCPNGFNVPSNTQNYQHNQTTGTYPATRTRARAAQETPYDRNEDDIEKKKDDVELIQ